jgi:purine-nucleoside phosphorylase
MARINTKEFFTFEEIQQTAAFIRSKTKHQPKIGLILGSGLSPLAEEITEADYIPYDQIPNFPVSGVVGHAGRLVIGKLADKTILVMQGRTHFYEGYSMAHITLPVRAMQLVGIETLIVTNAAGGLNQSFTTGDLMLITDHISFVGLAGVSPLRGPNLDEFGLRFPSMTHAYHADLMALTRKVAKELQLTLQEGIYVGLGGPAFETPAENRMLRVLGGDAVGMSTVAEVTVANHAKMRVLGISSITNISILDIHSKAETNHEEVLEIGKKIVPQLMKLLKGVLAALA